MLHYDAILFDVDGTLIDSAPGILNTMEEVFRSMGVDIARSDLGRYIGPPLRKSFGEHFSDPAKIEEATKRYRVSYAAKGRHEGDVYPGVVEMLDRLKAAGLTVPATTELLYELNKAGFALPLDALSTEECAQALFACFREKA